MKMLITKTAYVTIFIAFSCGILNLYGQSDDFQIIPKPTKLVAKEGRFAINHQVGIDYGEAFKVSANFLKDFIKSGSNIDLDGKASIHFVEDLTLSNPESYILDITPQYINIMASTDKGAFYAVQTLRQLLPTDFENGTYRNSSVEIPSVHIEDKPQFSYRGMHLDVGRHMFSVENIKKNIDALAMLKLNTFHWHLTEDQGWRIEIKKYPKLQENAAYRPETLIGHYNSDPQQFDGKRYGGFYTQEQIKEVVDYAKMRHVTIIPEIEMPGHAQAAISAYPELGCTGDKIDAATKWGVFEDIFCPKESTFEFLENVLNEVLELFPSEYIHIGGDEAPKNRWKQCSHCQELIKSEGLKDEHELQSYFITRIEAYLNKKGRQIIGWDEILEGGLAPNATVMSWRGTNGAVEAAKQHHNVIMTPTSHLYFDYYQSDGDKEPLAIGGFLPLEKVYAFNPVPEGLTQTEAGYVLGAQANLWTEYIKTYQQVEYMVFPRILALSEVVWSNPIEKNYKMFVERVEHFHERLDALDINYANHLYETKGAMTPQGFALQLPVQNKDIRYTLDGTDPNIHSKKYTKPLQIKGNIMVKAAAFDSNKRLGSIYSQSVNHHKAFGKKITLNVEPNKAYPGSGTEGMVNGISGSDTRFGDKEWLGFWGDDVEITIDLGEETEINSIEMRFYHAPGQWIYAPKELYLDLSLDGSSKKSRSIAIEQTNHRPASLKTQLNHIKSRFITIKVPNYGIIPEGRQGSGNKAWTFIDEIIIY